MHSHSYVWYASYGSNLCRGRFLCYIEGCRDKTYPKGDKQITIPFPLYFAKRSPRWGNQGVAFIGLRKDEKDITLGRMYLITEQQFSDVMSQENGNKCISVDLRKAREEGSMVLCKSWYGNIVYVGEQKEGPIFTFTSYWDIGDEPFVAPSSTYLKMLASGLKGKYRFTTDEIIKYLITKPGILNNFAKDKLMSFISDFA